MFVITKNITKRPVLHLTLRHYIGLAKHTGNKFTSEVLVGIRTWYHVTKKSETGPNTIWIWTYIHYVCKLTPPVQPDFMKSGVKANHYESLTLTLNGDELSTSRSGRLYHSKWSIFWLIKSQLKPTIMDLGLMEIKYFRLSYELFRPFPLQLIILPACGTDSAAKEAAKKY